MSERVTLLIQAAREVQNPELRDNLLEAALGEIEVGTRKGRPRNDLTNPEEISFPLAVFIKTPDGGQVEATLNGDASVLLDGELYSRPSSNPLMKRLGFEPGNAWPRWRFRTSDGNTFPIQVLRDHGLIKPSRKR